MPLGRTWMNLEGIVLSQISQTRKKKNTQYHLSVQHKNVKYIGAESTIVIITGKKAEEMS